MEGTLALLLVLALIVGGITLMLAAGYVSAEKSRARQHRASRRAGETAKAVDAIAALPGFFTPSTPARPVAFVFDDGLVHLLENHVRAEQAVVAQFVRQPSIDTLYRPRPASGELRARAGKSAGLEA